MASPSSSSSGAAAGSGSGTMPPPPVPLRMEGYLKKLKSEEGSGGKLGQMFARSRFNRRWFAIEEKEHASEEEEAMLAPYGPLYELKYWKNDADVGVRLPSFSLDLSAVRGCGAGVGLGPYTREAHAFHVETLQRTYVLVAADREQMEWWLRGLEHYAWQHNETVRRIEGAHDESQGGGEGDTARSSGAAGGVMLSPGRDSFATDATPVPAPSARRRASLPGGVQTQPAELGSPVSSTEGSVFGGGSPSPLPAFSPLAAGGVGLSPGGGGDHADRGRVRVQLQPFDGARSGGLGDLALRQSWGNPFDSARSHRSQAQADRSARAAALADQADEEDEIEEELEHKYDEQAEAQQAQPVKPTQIPAQQQPPRPRPVPGELSSPIRFNNPDVETARPPAVAAHAAPAYPVLNGADSDEGDDPFASAPAQTHRGGVDAMRHSGSIATVTSSLHSLSPFEALHSPHADASAPPQTERPAATLPSPLPGRLPPPIHSGMGMGGGAAPATNPHARAHSPASPPASSPASPVPAAVAALSDDDDDDPFSHHAPPAATGAASNQTDIAAAQEEEEAFTVLMSPVSPSAHRDDDHDHDHDSDPFAPDDKHGQGQEDPFDSHKSSVEQAQRQSPGRGHIDGDEEDEEALIRSSLDDSGDEDGGSARKQHAAGPQHDDDDDSARPLGSVRPAGHGADDSSIDAGHGVDSDADVDDRSLDAAEESILNGSVMLAESMVMPAEPADGGGAGRGFRRHPAVPQLRADGPEGTRGSGRVTALPPLAIKVDDAASQKPAAGATAVAAPAASTTLSVPQRSPMGSPGVPSTPLEVSAAIAAPAPAPPAVDSGFTPSHNVACNTAAHFAQLRADLRAYGVSRLQADMVAAGWFCPAEEGGDGALRVSDGVKPFNPFARLVSGKLSAPYGDHLTNYGMGVGDDAPASRFMVAQNRPELDAAWASNDAEMVGRASMGARHQFLLLRSLHWSTFNVSTLGMEPTRSRSDDLRAALDLLRDMERIAREYTRRAGWSDRLGMFFHAYPFNSVHALHMHMVDLSCTGPSLHKLAHKNLPLEEVVAVLRQELLQEERKTNRAHQHQHQHQHETPLAREQEQEQQRQQRQPTVSTGPLHSSGWSSTSKSRADVPVSSSSSYSSSAGSATRGGAVPFPAPVPVASASSLASGGLNSWQSQLSSLLPSDKLPYEDVPTARPGAGGAIETAAGLATAAAAGGPGRTDRDRHRPASSKHPPVAQSPAAAASAVAAAAAATSPAPLVCSCDECYGGIIAAQASQARYCWTCHTALCPPCAHKHVLHHSSNRSVPHQIESLDSFLASQPDAYCAHHALPAPALPPAALAALATASGSLPAGATGLRPRALRFTGLYTSYCDSCARLLCEACRAEDGVHQHASSSHPVRPLAAQYATHSAALRSLLLARVVPTRASLVAELASLHSTREQSRAEAAALRAETLRMRDQTLSDLRARVDRARADATTVSDAAAERLRGLDALEEALAQQESAPSSQLRHQPQQPAQQQQTQTPASMCAFLARAPALHEHARSLHESAAPSAPGSASALLQRLQREEQSVLSERSDADAKLAAMPQLEQAIATKDRDLEAILSSQRGVAAAAQAQAHSLHALYTRAHEEIAQWMALTDAAGRRLAALKQVCSRCAVSLSPASANSPCPAATAAAASSSSHLAARSQHRHVHLHAFVPSIQTQTD